MKLRIFLFLLFSTMLLNGADARHVINLSGKWDVAFDSTRTFQKVTFSHSIQLPGTTDDAGLGVPNKLSPALEKPQVLHLTRKHSFIGVAWYRRSIVISKEMANKPLDLFFERIMWRSQLWVDGKEIHQTQESLVSPHKYDLPEGLKAGTHVLVLRIDNTKLYNISVKDLAHSYTNDTQIMWNGILGKMQMAVLNKVFIQNISVYPDLGNHKIKVITTLVNTNEHKANIILDYSIASLMERKQPVCIPHGTQKVIFEFPMEENMKLWDEFSPNLYTLDVTCGEDSKKVSFGLRELKNQDGKLYVNGDRRFLRGTLDCCVFPLTGHPAMTESGWLKEFMTAKEWGLNHLRFHSWCPPEAAFRVADRLGFYLQVELPNWSLTVNSDSATNHFLYSEYNNIISNYGNHPSLCLISCGNELQPDFKFLNAFVKYMKAQDPRHLYTTTTFTFEKGHGLHPEPEDQFFVTQWTDHGWVRGQGIFDEEQPNFNKDYHIAAADIHTPLISHEVGQYAVYPNIKEIDKYSGVLEPLNLEAIKMDLKKKGLLEKAPEYLEASGKLAAILYKEEIERALKTPQFSGFQLLGLNDFPGQGTALVGLLDAFWDSKGLVDASDFRHFCAPVVPLARFDKAVYSTDEPFKASVEISNYTDNDLQPEKISWILEDSRENILSQGLFLNTTIKKGGITKIGTISTLLGNVKKACRMTLKIKVEGTAWQNSWQIWVYPPIPEIEHHDIVLTQDPDIAYKALKKGKKVLFSPQTDRIKGLEGKFLPVFWSPVHFPKQAGTMGLLCDPKTPALKDFPTEMHSDWQWWNLVKRSKVMILDSISTVTPLVEDVDNFINNRRLASIFEARCGKGKLIMSSMDLLSEGSNKPEVRQLLYSLVQYMKSYAFDPKTTITESDFFSLLSKNKKKESKTDATSIYQ